MRSCVWALTVGLTILMCEADAADTNNKSVDAGIHFNIIWEKDVVRLTPADPHSTLGKGDQRLSCRALRIERQGDRAVVVFVDADLESDQTRLVAKEIWLDAIGFGLTVKDHRLEFKTEEARRRFAKMHQNRAVFNRNSTEEGMKASEIEHWERWLFRFEDAETKAP